MKYLSKNTEYQSPIPTQGYFTNAWVETGKKTIDDTIGSQLFTVDFHLKFLKDEVPVTIETTTAQFGIKEETYILDQDDNEVELITFLTGGGIYDKERISQWGRPSFYGVQGYFDVSTIWADIQLTNQEPYRTIAKDWIDENISIQGLKIGENFELETV